MRKQVTTEPNVTHLTECQRIERMKLIFKSSSVILCSFLISYMLGTWTIEKGDVNKYTLKPVIMTSQVVVGNFLTEIVT